MASWVMVNDEGVVMDDGPVPGGGVRGGERQADGGQGGDEDLLGIGPAAALAVADHFSAAGTERDAGEALA